MTTESLDVDEHELELKVVVFDELELINAVNEMELIVDVGIVVGEWNLLVQILYLDLGTI